MKFKLKKKLLYDDLFVKSLVFFALFSLVFAFVSIKAVNVSYGAVLIPEDINDVPITKPKYVYNKSSVAFTFDDGPNGKKTRKLIDALEQRGMSATFFLVGIKISGDEETVKYIHNSSSEIGYHSWAHKRMDLQSDKVINDEFKLSNEILYNLTGTYFKYTRPPYGSYSSHVINSLSTPFFRWDLDTLDWKDPNEERIIKYVLDNYKDGSIILFHDTYDTTVDIAIKLMDIFKEKDVQVMSLTELGIIKNVEYKNHEVYYTLAKKEK